MRRFPVITARQSALLVFALPFTAINLAYVLSAQAEWVPPCFPYLEGCTSISAAGRHPPGSFVFKGLMFPAAAATVLYWRFAGLWLKGAAPGATANARTVAWLGGASAAFLVAYTVFLGDQGDAARTWRRVGTIGYFTLSFVAQLVFASRLNRSLPIAGVTPRLARTKLWLLLSLPLAGMISLPAQYALADNDPLENAMEWTFSLVMMIDILLTWRVWHVTRFDARWPAPHPPT